jgi:hypothetical protein
MGSSIMYRVQLDAEPMDDARFSLPSPFAL